MERLSAPRAIVRVVLALCLLFLPFSSTIAACERMGAQPCCAAEPCSHSPNRVGNLDCKLYTSAPDATLDTAASLDFVEIPVQSDSTAPVLQFDQPAPFHSVYSPPPLFLQHSALLI